MLDFCIKHEYSLRNGWVTHKWSNKFEIDKISFFISWNIFAISTEVTPGVFFWRQKYPDNFSEQTPEESQPRCLYWYPHQESLQVTQEDWLLNLHARWGTMQHSQESPVMVGWSSLGHSSVMGSTESWYEYHREFVDPVEERSCQFTSHNKQRGTEGKDFVSLEEPWKKTWCPEEPVWFNAQTCLCLGPV